MNSRIWVFASAVGVALAFALSGQAGGFNFGSFMFGGTHWVPECGATEILTEVKDKTGRSRWLCVTKQAADDKKQPADSTAQAADDGTQGAYGIVQAAADSGMEAAADSMAQAAADSAAQAAGGIARATNKVAQAANTWALVADSKVGGEIRSAELERPASPDHTQLSKTNDPQLLTVGD